MSLNPDFRDLFAALNAAQARYLLVGGYALAFHGRPRFTKDLDIWVEPSHENAAKVFSALESFGAPLEKLSVQDLSRRGLIFQIGIAPNRIDVLTSIDGVDFESAWAVREETRYGPTPVPVLSRQHLLANKRATGRPQDLLDAEELEKSD
jgi:hypothetical protein